MATLTYDPTPADQPEFNEAEQEALAIGEQAVADQEQLLAGKFKDAEALEQAYIELQKKLGTNEPEETEEGVRDEEPPTEEVEPSETTQLIQSASDYYAQNGELSPEMMEQFKGMSSEDLVNAFIEAQGQTQSNDLTDAQAAQIKEAAGGDEAYGQLTQWAANNLDEGYIAAYDAIVESGNVQQIQLAVAGLKAEYEKANGFEGQMLTGKAATPNVDVFRSQAEVVAAMQDPRYDRDPAFRQEVMDKLANSPGLNF